MVQDFDIVLYAPDGLAKLKTVLASFPIALDYQELCSGQGCLKQVQPSVIAGFEYLNHTDEIWWFSLCVHSESLLMAKAVIEGFSASFQQAGFAHRIVAWDEMGQDHEWKIWGHIPGEKKAAGSPSIQG